MIKKKLLFASKRRDGSFKAEEIVTDLDRLFSTLEYGDVYEGECQIWEYPSGKIFSLVVDKEMPEQEYYSTPGEWHPKLLEITVNRELVARSHQELSVKHQKS
jgi:hypothetical protein